MVYVYMWLMLPNTPLGEKEAHPRIQGVLPHLNSFTNDLAVCNRRVKEIVAVISLPPLECPFFSLVNGNEFVI